MVTTLPTVDERLDRMELLLETIAAELESQRIARLRWSELADDLTPIAKGALATAGDKLATLDVDTEQVVRTLEAVVRALPVLERLAAQLEPAAELVDTVAPLGKPAMQMAMEGLAGLEEKGYLDFARGGLQMADRVVTSFTQEDIDALGDNIVLILQTVKEMTQPEVMQMLQRTFHTVQADEHLEATEPPGALTLLREMRNPEVRRGLNKVLHMLRSVGEEAAAPVENRR